MYHNLKIYTFKQCQSDEQEVKRMKKILPKILQSAEGSMWHEHHIQSPIFSGLSMEWEERPCIMASFI